MKKRLFPVLLFFVLMTLLLLCACGNKNVNPQTAPTAEPAQETADLAPADSIEEAQPEVDKRELAETMVGKSMSELIELIGEPLSSDYAPSCLGPGEDGEHHYDGFIVYTYREGDMERIDEIYVEK